MLAALFLPDPEVLQLKHAAIQEEQVMLTVPITYCSLQNRPCCKYDRRAESRSRICGLADRPGSPFSTGI